MKVWLHAFLAWTIDEGEWLASRPAHFLHGKRAHVTNSIGGGLGGNQKRFLEENIFAPAGKQITIFRLSNPWPSHCNDYGFPILKPAPSLCGANRDLTKLILPLDRHENTPLSGADSGPKTFFSGSCRYIRIFMYNINMNTFTYF